jgi:hypothetical protein
MKKINVFVIGFVILFFINGVKANFIDSDQNPDWAAGAIERVKDADIMTGFGDGSFRPNNKLNRAEAVVLLFRTKSIDITDVSGVSKFPDVSTDVWFAKAVSEAVRLGWVTGMPDGKFHPEQTLNRAEWATLITRAFELEATKNSEFKDVPSKVWYSAAVFAIEENELVREKSEYFKPDDSISRADAAWTIGQILLKPRILGTSKENDFSLNQKTDSRRTAIKPRDFNPNKQSYDIEKKELVFTAVPRDEEFAEVTKSSDWKDLGTVRVANKLDDRVLLTSLEFKLRFEKTTVGPAEGFLVELRGGGVAMAKGLNKEGGVLYPGLEINIPAGEELVFRLKIKASADGRFYAKTGNGRFSLINADGQMISTFVKDNPDRNGSYRLAPIKFEVYDLTPVRFTP